MVQEAARFAGAGGLHESALTVTGRNFAGDCGGYGVGDGGYFSTRGNTAPDARVVTSGGRSIPVHSSVLAMASPVLEAALFDRRRRVGNSDKAPPAVPILGVPCDAVSAFIRYLYETRCTSEEMERYAMHLLALSHVYQLPRLKRACVGSLVDRLDAETVKTEGWRFLQANDPWLELEILQALHEIDLREKRRARNRKAQSVYLQLSEAMECLRHICTEGCTEQGPCPWFRTCQGLQRLIRHFATCERKKTTATGGGCAQCKRMWQLLRLHASVCDQPEPCAQFKLRTQQQTGKKGDDDARWGLLVRKVVSAKVMSALARKTN
ncbi:unnamed protein product [Spirodela intermedia]|uniref:BTB domain-containing protein n=1 Tax=Spirodela intermedia TaxID=51605 RepID=A0A7I8INT4_SPIIN|nr:unnamed protein product [Spirodela intermedia]CAA6659607.1 unnamed protein product [Spirodela intermedia]